jgi:hypothetical protein
MNQRRSICPVFGLGSRQVWAEEFLYCLLRPRDYHQRVGTFHQFPRIAPGESLGRHLYKFAFLGFRVMDDDRASQEWVP